MSTDLNGSLDPWGSREWDNATSASKGATMNTATKIDPTDEALKEMLGENTGRNMLDSGGAYGRNWERNQGRDFDAEPEATLEIWEDTWSITLNVFHFLRARVEYDPERTKAMREFSETPDYEREGWMVCVADWIKERGETKKIAGIYGEGNPFWVNTYNHESLLSQVIQFYYWTEEEWNDRLKRKENVSYIALQIHGGCDVRGGYTGPRVFRVGDTEIFDDQNAELYCDNRDCASMWYTDDGHHWYASNDEPDLAPKITDDALVCPCCGKGKLQPGMRPCG